MLEGFKPELAIKAMGVTGREHPTPQVLQLGMIEHRRHQPFTQTAAAIVVKHKNIADVSKCRAIADDPCKSDDPLPVIDPKTDRVPDRGLGLLAGPLAGPV
jgi:hypothetical protein